MTILTIKSVYSIRVLVFVLLFTLHIALAQDSSSGQRVCSVEEPRSDQVCVSIKFPWKEDPVFFCTDQGTVNYIPQCTDPTQSHHCHDDARNDTLKIATPWDCCPIISTPNKCANVECAPEPFNRTCKVMKILGDCCPTYYCDAGEPDNCKTSRLRTSCMNPPKDKVNCIAFRDPYGCCNKYQCAGEGKSGVCPRRRRNRDESVTMAPGFFDIIVSEAKQTVNQLTTSVKTTLHKHGGHVGRAIANVIPVPFQSAQTKKVQLRCSGDYNCPGTMKCCGIPTFGYSVSLHTIQRRKRNGLTKTKHFTVLRSESNPNQRAVPLPLDGICVEADGEATTFTYDESTTTMSTTTNDDDDVETKRVPSSFSSTADPLNEEEELSTPPSRVIKPSPITDDDSNNQNDVNDNTTPDESDAFVHE